MSIDAGSENRTKRKDELLKLTPRYKPQHKVSCPKSLFAPSITEIEIRTEALYITWDDDEYCYLYALDAVGNTTWAKSTFTAIRMFKIIYFVEVNSFNFHDYQLCNSIANVNLDIILRI